MFHQPFFLESPLAILIRPRIFTKYSCLQHVLKCLLQGVLPGKLVLKSGKIAKFGLVHRGSITDGLHLDEFEVLRSSGCTPPVRNETIDCLEARHQQSAAVDSLPQT